MLQEVMDVHRGNHVLLVYSDFVSVFFVHLLRQSDHHCGQISLCEIVLDGKFEEHVHTVITY